MGSSSLSRTADLGLLATLRELLRDEDEPPTTSAVAEAVGVPEEYSRFIEQRLEENARRGYVVRDGEGHWLLTDRGATEAAAASAAAA